jgi:hypothetical protein
MVYSAFYWAFYCFFVLKMPSMILRGFLVVGFCYDVGLQIVWDLGLGFDWEWGGIFIGVK